MNPTPPGMHISTNTGAHPGGLGPSIFTGTISDEVSSDGEVRVYDPYVAQDTLPAPPTYAMHHPTIIQQSGGTIHCLGLPIQSIPPDEHIADGMATHMMPVYTQPPAQAPMDPSVVDYSLAAAAEAAAVMNQDTNMTNCMDGSRNELGRLVALTLACMAARVVSSTLSPEAQDALEKSPPTTLAEAQSLMVLLQAKPRPRGRPKKSGSSGNVSEDELSEGFTCSSYI